MTSERMAANARNGRYYAGIVTLLTRTMTFRLIREIVILAQ